MEDRKGRRIEGCRRNGERRDRVEGKLNAVVKERKKEERRGRTPRRQK
jgi:hypothetical protein